MHYQSFSGDWQFREVNSNFWLPARVPGGVHTDLLAIGRIPDPFVADNELAVQWVGERTWEYKHSFWVEPGLMIEDRVWLVCDGLDTLADVRLNGHLLGHTENMFRQFRWEVKSFLREGENELLIIFYGPASYIQERNKERALGVGSPYIRKAPCHFGWDWGPILPTMGVWKDIRLEGYTTARLEDVFIRQSHEDGKVKVCAEIALERWQDPNLKVAMQLESPDGHVQKVEAAIGKEAGGKVEIQVENPQLWWPNGYGKQPLYSVEVLLYQGRSVVDRKSYQLGLRTIQLRQEPDAYGISFEFVVNGVPVFAKGADWIPADSFITRMTDEHLEHLISSAAGAHMNMLRVWGGGIYEEERFYDLCDQYGIMIWQDFIFACFIYPSDEAFFQNFRVEAIENIRRLRHRACLALWCGNNEMESGWAEWGWNKPDVLDLKAAYDRMFHHFIPGILAVEDPDRPYWPSSPSSGVAFHEPNNQTRGDAHYWEVWHGRKPFTAYHDQYPRFMSEFGFQSLPSYETVCTYADESQRNMTSYVMEHHQRSGNGNGLIVSQMTDTFRMPKDFQSLVYLSMVLQAEGIRFGVEHWRRNKHRVGGTLIWQLNDCWPVASWSSIDYFGRWKALHYAARRFYSPVLLSADQKETQVALHLTNDLNVHWNGEIRWSLETLDGKALDSGTVEVAVPALKSVKAWQMDFTEKIQAAGVFGSNRRDLVLVFELWRDKKRLSLGLVPFVANKHLNLTEPGLSLAVVEANELFQIEVKAERTARFVRLTLEGAAPEMVFSDNYFDLPAGRSVTVSFPRQKGWTLAKVRKALKVTSLSDSY